jgi:hypothetical protein
VSFLSEPISLQSLFGQRRKIDDITVNVVITENTNDTLTITKQPVQQGASITDHSYKEPTVFSTSILFRDNLFLSLSKLYQQLLDLQSSRVPFDVITPKRIYRNMLLATLAQTTDKNTENCLAINASFQEVILVKVSTTQVPRIKQKHPAATGATENAGKKSALLSLKEGVGAVFSR